MGEYLVNDFLSSLKVKSNAVCDFMSLNILRDNIKFLKDTYMAVPETLVYIRLKEKTYYQL